MSQAQELLVSRGPSQGPAPRRRSELQLKESDSATWARAPGDRQPQLPSPSSSNAATSSCSHLPLSLVPPPARPHPQGSRQRHLCALFLRGISPLLRLGGSRRSPPLAMQRAFITQVTPPSLT